MRKIKDFLKANKHKKILIVPVGVPGAGKSTLFENLSKDFDIKKVSYDDIRINFYRNLHPLDKRSNREIYKDAYLFTSKEKLNLKKEAKKQIKEAKENIIYLDNTNLTRKSRRPFLLEFSDFIKAGVYFDVPVEKCIERQFYPDRDKFVSPKVIYQHYQILEPPQIGEFDIVFKVKT